MGDIRMKAHRKGKIAHTEYSRIMDIARNYHKFLWKKYKRRIDTKRLNK